MNGCYQPAPPGQKPFTIEAPRIKLALVGLKPGLSHQAPPTEGLNLVRKFDRLKSRPLGIKIGRFCNSFVLNGLQIETRAGTQRALQDWKPSYIGFRSSINDQSLFPYNENKSETRTLAFPPDPRTDSQRTPRSAGLFPPGTWKNTSSGNTVQRPAPLLGLVTAQCVKVREHSRFGMARPIRTTKFDMRAHRILLAKE